MKQKKDIDESSIRKNFSAILNSFKSWIPGVTTHRHPDHPNHQDGEHELSSGDEPETAEARNAARRAARRSFRATRQRRAKQCATSGNGEHHRHATIEASTAKTPGSSETPVDGARKATDKKLPDLPATNGVVVVENTKRFSESEMAEAEKLFKEEYASLFETTSKTEQEEVTKQDTESVNKAESDDEGEEISILPLEVEIVDENQEEKPKKRVKCNSAGQEPPPVPVKPAYLRTISMTSVSAASSTETINNIGLSRLRQSQQSKQQQPPQHTWSLSSVASDKSESVLSQPFTLPHPNLDDFDRTKSGSTPNLANPPNQSSAHARSRSDSKDDTTKKHAPKRNNTLIKQLHLGRLENMPSIDPKRSNNEDSGVATNNESANEKPSSRKRSAREIAQLYEQLKSKHIQRKREWNQEREMLLMRCKATENSQQVLRNVRGILEQLRAELKREENRRNELEREFLQQKIVWDRERKELHEEIFELQRRERMWLEHGDQSDARVSVLHKKVQELRNEKLNILKRAEMDRMAWEEQKQQFIIQLRQLGGQIPPNLTQQNGMPTELNDRLDSALQQIETVSRQLCSVQQDGPSVNFQSGTLLGQKTRQISASTSALPENTNRPRPKSSFDLVRTERANAQREIFSDAPDLTTDDEARLPGLHKTLLFGSKGANGNSKG